METTPKESDVSKKARVEDPERKQSVGMYGTWFKKNASPQEIVEKCDELINRYKLWIQNLEEKKETGQ